MNNGQKSNVQQPKLSVALDDPLEANTTFNMLRLRPHLDPVVTRGAFFHVLTCYIIVSWVKRIVFTDLALLKVVP